MMINNNNNTTTMMKMKNNNNNNNNNNTRYNNINQSEKKEEEEEQEEEAATTTSYNTNNNNNNHSYNNNSNNNYEFFELTLKGDMFTEVFYCAYDSGASRRFFVKLASASTGQQQKRLGSHRSVSSGRTCAQLATALCAYAEHLNASTLYVAVPKGHREHAAWMRSCLYVGLKFNPVADSRALYAASREVVILSVKIDLNNNNNNNHAAAAAAADVKPTATTTTSNSNSTRDSVSTADSNSTCDYDANWSPSHSAIHSEASFTNNNENNSSSSSSEFFLDLSA